MGSSSIEKEENFGYGAYWTRSTYLFYTNGVYCVSRDGDFFGGDIEGVNFTIRPVIYVKP